MELNKPNPFKPNKNTIGQDWNLWKKEFQIYLRLSGCYEKCSEEERSFILINLMGTEGVKAMEQMTFDHPNERNDMDILIMKFDQIFDPPLNEVEERYKFFSRSLNGNEDIDNFVIDLKIRASTCNFGLQSEKFVIDMVIRNLGSYLQEVIFALEDVSLDEVIKYYKQYVINNNKIKELTEKAVSLKSSKDRESPNKSEHKSIQSKFCWKCTSRHVYGICPAYGNICSVCNQRNHFNGLCGKQRTNNQKEETKRICSKCGTNHPYKQCPAYDNICGICSSKGHYIQHCKQKEHTVESADKNTGKYFNTNLKDCLWCGRKHFHQNDCPHPVNCRRCDAFPHNICFQCKKNPHDTNCYFKTILTLPSETRVSDQVNLRNCINCGTNHGSSPCNPFQNNHLQQLVCGKCKNYGHLAHACELFQRQSNNNQYVPRESAAHDSLLKDYVKVEYASGSLSNNLKTTSKLNARSASNANYSHNINKQKSTQSSSNFNNAKKPQKKQQPDACIIS